jgi:hypothetical protein
VPVLGRRSAASDIEATSLDAFQSFGAGGKSKASHAQGVKIRAKDMFGGQMRRITLIVLTLLFLSTPARSSEPFVATASPSYNPWIAAGLTYAPGVAGFATSTVTGAVGNSTGLATGFALLVANPFPGRGHDYVGESGRGLLFFGGSCALLAAALTANISIYYKIYEMGHDPLHNPSSPLDPIRDGINIGYVVTSAALSAWASWDAYRIAEEKNRTVLRP